MLLTTPSVKGVWLKEGYKRSAIFKTSFTYFLEECKSKTRLKAQEKIVCKHIWISIQFHLTLRFFSSLFDNLLPPGLLWKEQWSSHWCSPNSVSDSSWVIILQLLQGAWKISFLLLPPGIQGKALYSVSCRAEVRKHGAHLCTSCVLNGKHYHHCTLMRTLFLAKALSPHNVSNMAKIWGFHEMTASRMASSSVTKAGEPGPFSGT